MDTDDPARSDPDLGFFQQELFWVEQYGYLEQRGYRLRSRYKPGVLRDWIVKWRQGVPLTGTTWKEIEDVTTRPSAPHMTSVGIDAVRLRDGLPVFIKCLWTLPDGGLEYELHLNRLLQEEPRRSDRRNPCPPLFDYFTQVSGGERRRFLVFPFLRRVRLTPFRLAQELLDFTKQVISGIGFLHEQGIAHRDIHLGNLTMDPTTMWPPHGPRPLRSATRQFDVTEERPTHDRLDVPVKYFIIDLGLSSQFKPKESRMVKFEAGVCIPPECFDTDRRMSLDEVRKIIRMVQNGDELPPGTPEWTREYDPFPADIYATGLMLKHILTDSLPALSPLLDAMTDSDPQARPTAAECLRLYNSLSENIPVLARIRPALDLSVEHEYSGVWKLLYGSRAVLRHWLEWARLSIKLLLYH